MSTHFAKAHDEHLTDRDGAERFERCTCCGAESSEIDALGRCPAPRCALASRIDNEVPVLAIRSTLRLSALAFAGRHARRFTAPVPRAFAEAA